MAPEIREKLLKAFDLTCYEDVLAESLGLFVRPAGLYPMR